MGANWAQFDECIIKVKKRGRLSPSTSLSPVNSCSNLLTYYGVVIKLFVLDDRYRFACR